MGEATMNGRYILDKDGRTPIPCEDLLVWAKWFENSREEVKRCRVKRTEGTLTLDPHSKKHLIASTVFLCLDHNYTGEGPPLLFESMLFQDGEEIFCFRYSTWDEAEEGHNTILENLTVMLGDSIEWEKESG